MKFYRAILFVPLILGSCLSFCQTSKILSAVTRYQKLLPVEKLYLHTDKPYYSLGDTLWYKAYLLNADFLDAATRSGLLYVELISDSGKTVKRQLIAVQKGISWGNITLNGPDFKEGTYTLRAYTNWMRNFGEAYFFSKQIQLYNPVKEHWLVKSKYDIDKGSARLHLQLSRINNDPLILHEVGLKVINGNKNIYQDRAETKFDGTLDVNFAIPDKPDQLTLQLTGLRPGEGYQRLNIPVLLNRPEYTDLQFMPEGGNLVAGILNRVAFKAIGENGKAVEVSGKVYNSKQQQVAHFTSAHLGMGCFNMVPIAGEIYTARLNDDGGKLKAFDLPKVKPIGTAIAVTNVEFGDSLKIKVMVTNNLAADKVYYLTGQSHDLICYAASVRLKGNESVLNIPKSAFPSGIARFSLLNQDWAPLNERIVYINHQDNLRVSVISSRISYKTFDSVALSIQVKDELGQSVQGSFSVAVTDNGQVVPDTSNNIITHMLLTSDLKGEVENSAYYFNGTANAVTDLDNLMLTQGWTGYDWKDIFNPKGPALHYTAEPEYIIRGKVTNFINKPVKYTTVNLISTKKNIFILNTTTDDEGRFYFSHLPPLDTINFRLQAFNHAGKSFNVGLSMDEFVPPEFSEITTFKQNWYINPDTVTLNYISKQTKALIQVADPNTRLLKEVEIKGARTNRNVVVLSLNEESLSNSKIAGRHLSLLQLITLNTNYHGDKILYVDDSPIDFAPNATEAQKQVTINNWLDSYTVDNIKRIKIIYIKPDVRDGNSKLYISIRSNANNGWRMESTGTYIYRPLPVSQPRAFYAPRYIIRPSTTPIDFRSTVHWVPNITTDAAGKAFVSFYSAATSGTYMVRIEGADMNGKLGYDGIKIKIDK